MWSSSQLLKGLKANRLHTFGRLFAATCALTLLAACSFTPLYGNGAGSQKIALSYANPTTRAEQVIYQQLGLRLGRIGGADAPLVTISATPSSRTIGRSSTGLPISTAEVTVTAVATVTETTDAGTQTLYKVTKSKSATYSTNGQRLADQQAKTDATNRAALAVGDSLSLLIRAKLTQ